MRTRDRTTYSQFLNIAASPPVGHDVPAIASFGIPCNLCPVVASLLFVREFVSFYNEIQLF